MRTVLVCINIFYLLTNLINVYMFSIDYTHRFITSLFFTVIVETIVLFLLIRFAMKNKKLSTEKIITSGIFASFATIPYVWFVFPYLFQWSINSSLRFSEPFAFIIEAVFYRQFLKTDLKTSFLLSLICNLASFILGPILRSQGIWLYW